MFSSQHAAKTARFTCTAETGGNRFFHGFLGVFRTFRKASWSIAVNSSVFPAPHPYNHSTFRGRVRACYEFGIFFCFQRVEFKLKKKKKNPTKKLKTRALPAELEYYANKRFKPFGAGQVYVLPGRCRIFSHSFRGKSLTPEQRRTGLAQLFFARNAAFFGARM